MKGRIDFADLAARLLDRAEHLVPAWLPGGTRRGKEWVCADLSGGTGTSCSVDMQSGKWADFAGDDRGGDLVSLFAAIHGLDQLAAARLIMADMGWGPAVDGPAPAPRAPRPAPAAPPPADEGWATQRPVPAMAPAATFRHHYRQPGDIEHTAEYRCGDDLHGYVVRFRTSDGGKDTLPYTWCVSRRDGGARWVWRQFDEPRPLYLPDYAAPAGRTVVLVEGEKKADALQRVLDDGAPGVYCVASWAGGCKAWKKADWAWLASHTVLLWPDCDAKHQPLTHAERKATPDKAAQAALQATKPLLVEHQQPGMAAMLGIGALLRASHGCTVQLLPIPKPGTVADGWDCGDAILAEGWGFDRVMALLASAHALPAWAGQGAPVDEPAGAPPAGPSPPSTAGAGGDDGDHWRAHLIDGKGGIKPVRENVVLALDGRPLPDGGWLWGIPEASGVIAFNDFTNDVIKLKPTPWGTPAGTWDEADELELGAWLSREHWLPPMSRQTLEEAVSMVARRHRYHPALQRFEALRGTWDGVPRLSTWLARCCRADMAVRPDELPAAHDERLAAYARTDTLGAYLARVGRWVLMATCARVLTPGCKFDYMLILEGGQGIGKSTLARLLGGDWFADTGLVLGDKDSYQNLQGVLVYEWGELDSLTRSEVTKVKQFISSQKDRFRASFDRRPKDYPRQVVFVGTTNESHYLSDPTGNRRFWPVRVTRQLDLPWLRANLDQLWAEALHLLDAGQRFHPTPAEQRELFDPQQTERTVENALESAIRRYLYDESQKPGINGLNGTLIDEITLADLLSALAISVDKQTQQLTKQASAALGRMGWERGRASGKGGVVRPWVYRRPKPEPGASDAIDDSPAQGHDQGAAVACPF